ncbi:MAG: Dabb family protein [Alphaproteobacteria bacterium]|nr:Dabb family protein [Alphaproteobacteria bacterium]
MIRHIVFFTVRDPSQKKDVMTKLTSLGSIPGPTFFEVRENEKMDQIANDIDIVVYGEFPDASALSAYKNHPIYEATTKAVRPLRDLRFAADFTTRG